MNRKKIIEEIKQDYAIKRVKATERCDELIAELKKDSAFDKIYTDLIKKELQLMRDQYSKDCAELRKDVTELKGKIEKYLTKKHLSPSSLSPKYECPICKDTGIANGQMCECMKRELNERLSRLSSSQANFKSFADLDKKIMNAHDIKAMEVLSTWCNNYPNVSKTNINIIGASGAGKTVLLECIAGELLKKGYVVCFKTAFELNEIARLYHTGKSFGLSDAMDAEILLIDDLGTEPLLKNVTKEYLYNIINMRQVKNLPTIISTNLSQEDILNRYDERIYSRLANKAKSINILLDSTDKRIK